MTDYRRTPSLRREPNSSELHLRFPRVTGDSRLRADSDVIALLMGEITAYTIGHLVTQIYLSKR